ncbi:MAG: hypothetical protein AMJ67_16145, partial [Betaproteobacteria bacterium SG8_41]
MLEVEHDRVLVLPGSGPPGATESIARIGVVILTDVADPGAGALRERVLIGDREPVSARTSLMPVALLPFDSPALTQPKCALCGPAIFQSTPTSQFFFF